MLRTAFFTLGLCYITCITGIAQTVDRNAFHAVDSLVFTAGPMRDSTLGAIVRVLTRNAKDDLSKVRAIYLWTAVNIAYDCVHRNSMDRVSSTASAALNARVATSAGFAGLIGEMCRMCYVTCGIVNGTARWEPEDIGKSAEELSPYVWNVVQAGRRKFVLDAAAGSGTCAGRTFTKQTTDAWFLTNRRLFALAHFPQDKRQQLLDMPIERSVFLNAPVVGVVPSILGMLPADGQRGIIRARQNVPVRLSYFLPRAERAITASIIADGERRKAEFEQAGDSLHVRFILTDAGEYPVYVLLDTEHLTNGGPAFGYHAIVPRRQKRRS